MKTEEIEGITVYVSGNSGPAVLFLHGWPDSYRLWDSAVAALSPQFRCIRFSLPGYDLSKPPRGTSAEEMNALIATILDRIVPGEKVHLVMHDWGCIFGQYVMQVHADRIARVVATDIGDFNTGAFTRSLSAKAKFSALFYQLWLAFAYKLGGIAPGIATGMTRWMAGKLKCPVPPEQMSWQMNYPYAMTWFSTHGNFKAIAKVKPKAPLLYLYGERKPFQFHSPQWLEAIRATPGCYERGLAANHWVMIGVEEFLSTGELK
jgi:cis-3-alkyl-4-acyloxetan-2-one decarboxylase